MNLPFPQDEECRSDFAIRWHKHKAVLTTYATPGARLAALASVWAKAKATSLVSIKTSVDEVVLFGAL